MRTVPRRWLDVVGWEVRARRGRVDDSFGFTEGEFVMVRDVLPGHHVVVVDDDERLLALARLALQKQGIRVSTAATAEEARKLVAADPPDLVILDIVLPDMSGWELLRQIRETDDCLVMLLSGRDSDIDKARGLDLGADDYLTKPFSFLEFEARVRALLRRAPVRAHAEGEHAGPATGL